MYRVSFLHGGMSDDGDKCWTGRQVRNRPGQMRFMWHMCIGLPCFGNFPGTIKNKTKNIGGNAPIFMVKTVAKRGIKYNTYDNQNKKVRLCRQKM